MSAFAFQRRLWLVLVCAVLLGLGACATNTPPKAHGTTAPTPAAPPYPTPGVWQRFTLPGLIAMEYPFGWTQTPYLEDTEIFTASPGGFAPDSNLVVTLSASSVPGDIASFCPAHPTTSVATLPAAPSSGYDRSGRPYYAWSAANQSIGVRFIVTFGSAIGASTLAHLSRYRGIYTHMLQSITIPPQETHAAACGAS